jgi:hypothetical protein
MKLFLELESRFDELIRFLEDLFSVELATTSDQMGKKCVFSCLCVEFCVVDNHGLENDCGIPFEDYSIEIDLRKLRLGEALEGHDAVVLAVSEFLSACISRHFGCEVRLLKNLQRSVAVYSKGIRRVETSGR